LESKRFKFYSNERNLPIAKPDDVLLVWDGSIGKCASGISGIIGSTIIGLTPLGNIPAKFIEYVIRYANKTIKETSTGTGLQHINRNFIDSYIIRLPPLPEQKRIAAKLDAILPKIKAAKTRLEKAPAMLKKFRQSVLAAACSGRRGYRL
ncbi:restriction endonuclease subunit S, partial [Treponema endosymbiont of Eucomonympha sp.]|uniref:restriction endonuclease subunit S n=1 Tax=Treponema endosymbiont of Eucomonympha sp. TaxID=1580831 RepID=UPI000A7AD060